MTWRITGGSPAVVAGVAAFLRAIHVQGGRDCTPHMDCHMTAEVEL